MGGHKGAIIDWIMPKGQILNLHTPWNVKCGRGFNHEHTGALLCPTGLNWNNLEYFLLCFFVNTADIYILRTRAKLINGQIQVAGDQWPIFLFANYTYCAGDPWNGLLWSGLLVLVSL